MMDGARRVINARTGAGDTGSGTRLPRIDTKMFSRSSSSSSNSSVDSSSPRRRTIVTPRDKRRSDRLAKMGVSLRGVGDRNSNVDPTLRTSISSSRLTKQDHGTLSLTLETKASDRLSMEIGHKISSMERTISGIEKDSTKGNQRLQEAVKRSNVQSRSPSASHLYSDRRSLDACIEKYYKEMERESTDLHGRGDIAELLSPRECPKVFGLDSMAVLESDDSDDTSDSDSLDRPMITLNPRFASPKIRGPHSKRASKTRINNPERSLSPIMPQLSEKAFSNKLKKREEEKVKSMQQMQSKLYSIQQRVDIDKKKAVQEENKNRPLYNPKPNSLSHKAALNSIRGPRSELIDFVQSTGGMAGSWKPEDHASFIKAYRRWKEHPGKLIDAVMQQVYGKSAKDVMAHIKWYEEYDSLNKANKEQLRQWDMTKKSEREMIYQMASEGQKAKLENEKRRQAHLKAKREEERQRSRAMITQWKKSKDSSQLRDSPTPQLNINNIQKEMLELAEKMQSISGVKKLKPPMTKLKPFQRGLASSTRNKADNEKLRDLTSDFITKSEEAEYDKHVRNNKGVASNPVTRPTVDPVIHLPTIEERLQKARERKLGLLSPKKQDSLLRKRILNGPGGVQKLLGSSSGLFTLKDADLDSDKGSGTKLEAVSFPSASRLTQETQSYKFKRDEQRLKRMDLQSLKARVPNRSNDSKLWETSDTLASFRTKKAAPSWRAQM